jgi:hypothetical protein
MRKFHYFLVIGLLSITVCACGGFSRTQDPISHFNQAAHAASNAESAFLNAVHIAECEAQFYTSAYNYSTSKDPTANFALIEYCRPIIVTPDQITTRNTLMSAIVLYADKMQALGTSDNDKQLDANSQKLAKNLNKLASTGGIKLQDSAIVQGAEAAVSAIAKMALDQVVYSDLKTAAQNMQPNLEDVVRALKIENLSFGKAMSQSFRQIESLVRIEISLSHQVDVENSLLHKRKPNEPIAGANTFFKIINGRSILISADPVTKDSLASPAKAPNRSPADAATPVNDALDAIVKANQAIANAGSGGIYAAANDLYTRAMKAKEIYESIAKSK